jgi:hypothetical protein
MGWLFVPFPSPLTSLASPFNKNKLLDQSAVEHKKIVQDHSSTPLITDYTSPFASKVRRVEGFSRLREEKV